MEKIKKNRKFIIVLAVALLLLGGAVWLNLSLNRDDELSAEEPTPAPAEDSRETMVNVFSDFFNAFRTERSQIRAQEIDYLRSIINSESTDSEALADAQARLLDLVGKMEKEFTIESRIRSKGFLDAAATYQGNTVSVVIDGETLTDEEVAKILDIVMTETGLPASAVNISLGS